MSEPIFKNWTSDVTAKWGKAPLSMEHRLHEHPLFTLEAIEQLIETYPCEHYALVHMGAQGSPKQSWREGDIGKLTGKQVIEAIGQGRMWIIFPRRAGRQAICQASRRHLRRNRSQSRRL